MIMLEPCSKCGKKDAITISSMEHTDDGKTLSIRWRIMCNRCGRMVETDAEDQDPVRLAWNMVNKKPEGPIQ